MNTSRHEPAPDAPAPVSFAVVHAFAAALDRNDFAGARAFLAPDVRYDDGRETWTGADAVLAAYARSAEWTQRRFDEVRYESAVAADPEGGFVVGYTDYLLKVPGRWHRHRCEQRVWLDDSRRIVRILHRELPGEAESLRAFLEAAGITD